MRIIGIDPGLQATGWGVIASDGAQLRDVDHGESSGPLHG